MDKNKKITTIALTLVLAGQSANLFNKLETIKVPEGIVISKRENSSETEELSEKTYQMPLDRIVTNGAVSSTATIYIQVADGIYTGENINLKVG